MRTSAPQPRYKESTNDLNGRGGWGHTSRKTPNSGLASIFCNQQDPRGQHTKRRKDNSKDDFANISKHRISQLFGHPGHRIPPRSITRSSPLCPGKRWDVGKERTMQ
jgi:hypothetical protein